MSETIKNDPANYLTRDKIAAHNAREAAAARPAQPEDTLPYYKFQDAFVMGNGWVDLRRPKDWKPEEPRAKTAEDIERYLRIEAIFTELKMMEEKVPGTARNALLKWQNDLQSNEVEELPSIGGVS